MFEKKIPIDAVVLKRLTGPVYETGRPIVYNSQLYRRPQDRADSHINMWQVRGDMKGIDLVQVTYRWFTRDELTFFVHLRHQKHEFFKRIDLENELKKHLDTLEPKIKMEFLEHYEM